MASIAITTPRWNVTSSELHLVAVQENLGAVILLAGSVRSTELSTAVGRSVLDLPLTHSASVLKLWAANFEGLRRELPQLQLRVLLDHKALLPDGDLSEIAENVSRERDPLPFRGTGGLLSDIARDYRSDEHLLVADAAQVLRVPLVIASQMMREKGGDVVIAVDDLGHSVGLMRIRCGVLAGVPRVGFADLKEQVLPWLKSQGADIRVLRLSGRPALGVRSAADYLDAARKCCMAESEVDPEHGDAHSWSTSFVITEAAPPEGARLHDCVILRGGIVERDATVIRSIVCPGAVVRRGEQVVNQIVWRGGRKEIYGD